MPEFDPEAEGIPAIEDNPPGIDGDNDIEGMVLPGDTPVGADEWGTTSREERYDEPIAQRVLREQPDVEPGGADIPLGRLVESDQGVAGLDHERDPLASMTRDDAGLSAEEAAMHITDLP